MGCYVGTALQCKLSWSWMNLHESCYHVWMFSWTFISRTIGVQELWNGRAWSIINTSGKSMRIILQPVSRGYTPEAENRQTTRTTGKEIRTFANKMSKATRERHKTTAGAKHSRTICLEQRKASYSRHDNEKGGEHVHHSGKTDGAKIITWSLCSSCHAYKLLLIQHLSKSSCLPQSQNRSE